MTDNNNINNNKQILKQKIEQCATFEDTIPFLKNISIDSIKEFINQQINQQFNDEHLNKFKLSTLALDEIIPEDIIFSIIIKFLNYMQNASIRRVNKKWHQMTNVIMKRHYQKIITILNQQV